MRKILGTRAALPGHHLSGSFKVFSVTVISLFSLLLSNIAVAGVCIEFMVSSRTHAEGKSDRSGKGTKTIRVDGSRFQILGVRGGGTKETSLDDGVTTFFNQDRNVTQTPLVPDVASISGLFSPIKAWVEDDKMTISEPRPGPMLLGMPTQIYTVDHSYVAKGRIAFVYTLRFPGTARYVITTANLVTADGSAVSPAAVRVMLSRGYGRVLAHHAEAFHGFPLRIEGHMVGHSEPFQGAPLWVNGRLVNGEGVTSENTTDFQIEAADITACSWPDAVISE